MLWGKTSRPGPRVSTLVPFIIVAQTVAVHLTGGSEKSEIHTKFVMGWEGKYHSHCWGNDTFH